MWLAAFYQSQTLDKIACHDSCIFVYYASCLYRTHMFIFYDAYYKEDIYDLLYTSQETEM